MAKQAKFYVSYFEDPSRGYGFRYSDKKVFDETDFENGVLVEKIEKAIRNRETGETDEFATAFVNFTDAMRGYTEFLRLFAGMSSLVSDTIGREALLNFLNTNGHLIANEGANKICEMPEHKMRQLLEIRDILKSSKIVGRQIP